MDKINVSLFKLKTVCSSSSSLLFLHTELETPKTCANCEMLKKENKRIRSWWETSKTKLSVVREELKTLKDTTGIDLGFVALRYIKDIDSFTS